MPKYPVTIKQAKAIAGEKLGHNLRPGYECEIACYPVNVQYQRGSTGNRIARLYLVNESGRYRLYEYVEA